MKLRYLLLPAAILGVAWLGASLFFVRQVRHFEPVTHQDPFTDPAQITEYKLDGRRTPADFGFARYDTVSYRSRPDGLRLTAWWLPAEQPGATSTVVLLHGRNANRLKPMKYLPLLRQAGLPADHHVLLPDLRNSGTSDPATTSMGWEFAEDVVSSLEFAAGQGVERVTVYAFSMGALALALVYRRPELRARLAATGLTVDRIVLDSPLADVAGTLRGVGERDGIPAPLMASALAAFDASIGGHLDELTIAPFVADPPAPLLLLQGTDDEITLYPLFEQAARQAGPGVQVETFEDARHVKILTDPRHADRYRRVVTDFLRPAGATRGPERRTPTDE